MSNIPSDLGASYQRDLLRLFLEGYYQLKGDILLSVVGLGVCQRAPFGCLLRTPILCGSSRRTQENHQTIVAVIITRTVVVT